jgi:hypothetical protein
MKEQPDRSELKEGDLFWTGVEDLHPTQFCVGIVSAECKRYSIEEHAADGKLREFLCKEGHLVPVIIGPPHKTLYLTDHHHLCTALWRARLSTDVKKEVAANVIHDWSDMKPVDFWLRMIDEHYTWLHDMNGVGPLNPSLLPDTIGGVLNDPYRTLSRWIRDAGCYFKDELEGKDKPMCDRDSYIPSAKNAAYFIEFRWANFLRQNVSVEDDVRIYHLPCGLMPLHPHAHFKREVKMLRRALPQVIRLIGCHQLEKVTYDDKGCLAAMEPVKTSKKKKK